MSNTEETNEKHFVKCKNKIPTINFMEGSLAQRKFFHKCTCMQYNTTRHTETSFNKASPWHTKTTTVKCRRNSYQENAAVNTWLFTYVCLDMFKAVRQRELADIHVHTKHTCILITLLLSLVLTFSLRPASRTTKSAYFPRKHTAAAWTKPVHGGAHWA